MNLVVCTRFLASVWNSHCPFLITLARFSTTDPRQNYKKYRRRWVTTEKWRKNTVDGKPWAPNVPMEHNVNPWTKENAYFGMYDFMDFLGDDLTMHPDLFCKGPAYMRGQKLNELQMLIKRKKMYGSRMHAEDLHATSKRIKYLLKVFNRVKRKTHG